MDQLLWLAVGLVVASNLAARFPDARSKPSPTVAAVAAPVVDYYVAAAAAAADSSCYARQRVRWDCMTGVLPHYQWTADCGRHNCDPEARLLDRVHAPLPLTQIPEEVNFLSELLGWNLDRYWLIQNCLPAEDILWNSAQKCWTEYCCLKARQ